LIAIVGPTGVGKSRLGIQLAQVFKGEIVNADSRQVYRLMDIGTAKPTVKEMASVPHHLFDIINPDQDFSLAQYLEMVANTITAIQQRNRIPILVGGSGQYIWATLEGWTVPRVPPDHELRKKMELEASEQGIDDLYQRLQEIDPAAAQKIDKRNIRRVIRALEVSVLTGRPVSSLQVKKAPDYNSVIIGLTAGRQELYHRIDDRVDEMIQRGLIPEVNNILAAGYNLSLPSMSSIGYKQIGSMLRGEIEPEEAIKQIKTASHRFVRHQYAWFKLDDRRIQWFDVAGNYESEALELVSNWLS
jgi:tRNA dimethylallyltransferase